MYIPKLQQGSYYLSLSEPRRRAEQARLAVIQQAYVEGVSVRRIDDLLKALGLTGIDKSAISRICQQLITGRLQVYLELGHPRPGGNQEIDQETLRLCLSFGGASFWSRGTSGGFFEDELRDLQQALPEDVYLKACISCAFSDYSPVGHGLFGSLACFRGNKAAYRQVTGKQALFAIWDTMTEFVQETYLCPEFEHRRPGAGYRG